MLYQGTSQRHLRMILDNRLSFEEHLKLVFNKINKTIGLLRSFQCVIPRSALLNIYTTLVRFHLDYGDIKYEKVYDSSFHQKIESIQYNACLATRGTSKEKLLVLEPIRLRRWFRKLRYFNKLCKN